MSSMENCVFCRIIDREEPAHIVFEDKDTVAFLDKYPQTRGHLQLLPKKHYRWLYDLPDMGNFFATAQTIIRGIIPALGADHVTIATFGHMIPHAHLWIVPQYGKNQELRGEWGGKLSKENSVSLANLLKSALGGGAHDT